MWLQVEGGAPSDYTTEIEVDVRAFMEYHQVLTGQVEETRKLLDATRTLTLTYDDLTEKYERTMAQIQDFLGLPESSSVPEFARQRQRPWWEYVRNADEVRMFLADQGL